MKIPQLFRNIFVPHQNVAKYFHTPWKCCKIFWYPPCFTPPWYPALKMTGPLKSKAHVSVKPSYIVEKNIISNFSNKINTYLFIIFSILHVKASWTPHINTSTASQASEMKMQPDAASYSIINKTSGIMF